MPARAFLQKVMTAPKGEVHQLHGAKAAKMHAQTMYIPSPLDVALVIQAIPAGQTRTLGDIRQTLSTLHGVHTTCPAKIVVYWKWLAAATVELDGAPSPYAIPWWRILKDGKPSRHMPGGIANQLALIQAEAV